MFKRFEYKPLNNSKNEIRLLEILPADEDGDNPAFQGELVHATLEDESFIAISYAWEDPTLINYPPDSQCILDLTSDAKLSIGRNLTALLSVVQKTLADTYLWIDAICINQEDITERNKEVTRMRDIYRSASDVLIWLGPEENDSDLALSLMGMITHQNITTNPSFEDFTENPEWPKWPEEDIAWVMENIDNGNHLPQWRAFNSLLERTWWVRVWMCQELALAQNVTFLCGLGIFSRHDFYSVVLNICQEDFDWINDVLVPKGISLNKGRLDIIFDLLLLWNSADVSDLLQVMWLTIDRLATDERDKIYGILGLATDAERIVPEADYTLSISNLYRNLTKAMIEERGDLDFLSLVFNRPLASSNPPWMPTASRAEIYMFNTSFFEPSMRSFSFQAAGDTGPKVDFSIERDSLTAEGFVLDVVDGLGPAWSDSCKTPNMIQSSHKTHYPMPGETFRALWMSLVGSINEVSDGFSLAPDIFGELFAAQCCNLEDKMNPKTDEELSEMEASIGFPRWYARHRNWGVAGKTIREWTQSVHASNTLPFLQVTEHEVWRDFDKMWKWLVPGRRLMSSRKGLLGLVPDSTQSGDLVCILFGGRMPFILRPIEEGYFLLGDSYVHGVMRGEIMADFEEGSFQKTVFSIR
ncbi:uncharacterized protein LY89DRAFT_238894 [Mollisia scopiformis]|uniref:Heterokaryon incompatibility domain-containing protein n=1 Tax=Mollisia scopiformis TaxID=149040 RepID=A0A194WU82_MOLSC|nr:uncharacterized protein LY89DRAFT_238894 [Mollisia scopiformis]KUJ11167.1 hypothetical protein LY89DRAFT_238894 [Mollisia scopiformis]